MKMHPNCDQGSATRRWCSLVVILAAPLFTAGCSSLKLPMLNTGGSDISYVPVGRGVSMAGGMSAESFNRVRQAKMENAVVLEVVGDEAPLRVLPLPPGETSVFVSQLLKQTGVQEKMGGLEATLYRYRVDQLSGIPMDVKMDKAGELVRPESDYALRAGDRLQVRKMEISALGELGAVLGL